MAITVASRTPLRAENHATQLFADGVAAVAAGDLAGAESMLRASVALQETTALEADLAHRRQHTATLNVFGALLQSRGELAAAEAQFRRSAAIANGASGEMKWELADSLGLLAQVRLDRGDHDEAGRLASRALTLAESAIGSHRAELARMLNTLAEVRLRERRFEDAESLLRRADGLADQEDGSAALRCAVAVRRGILRLTLSRFREAEPFLERGLELARAEFGPQHPSLGRVMQLLADCYRLRQRSAEARSLYEGALAMTERIYGSKDPQLVPALVGLALVAQQEDQPGRADILARRAHAILEGAPRHDPESDKYRRLLVRLARPEPAAADPLVVATAAQPPS